MRVYLDNLATTPLDPRVLDAMMPLLDGPAGNPHSSVHWFGSRAADALETARSKVAEAARVRSSEVYLVPSATIANNLAVTGTAISRGKRGRHVLVSAVEHPSVLETARQLAEQGFTVEEVPVTPGGIVETDVIRTMLREDTFLVSVMAVNNEVGTVQPVEAIADLLAGHGALFHCDAAQAAGKVSLDRTRGADLVTLSSHKVYGPQGAAALIVRSSRQVKPSTLLFGGEQEKGLWPGTANVAASVGLATALELAEIDLASDRDRVEELAGMLSKGLDEAFPGTVRNGDPGAVVPQCLSLRFSGVSGEMLLSVLSGKGIGASFGSACAASTGRPSHVLTAMGLTAEDARQTLRFGIGRFTMKEEIDYTLEVVRDLAGRLKRGA